MSGSIRSLHATLLVLVLCSAEAPSQGHVVSPPGFATVGANGLGRFFGAYSDHRAMQFDGELPKQAMTIKEVAFRLFYTKHWSGTAGGRTWSNVKLNVSECDMSRLSWTFSQNPIGTPKSVFSGSVTFPNLTTYPSSNPAPWSIKLPFRSSFAYSGNRELCLDFDFTGGALANAVPWPATSSHRYFLDGVSNSQLGPFELFSTKAGCVDSRSTNTWGGGFTLKCAAYNGSFATPSYRNKHSVYMYAHNVGPSTTVVHAIGAAGNRTGVALPGVPCNRLHVDVTQPTLWYYRKSDSRGSTYRIIPVGDSRALFAYNPALVGIKLWGQAAWNDTGNGRLRLTFGLLTSVPAMPKTYKRQTLLMTDPKFKNRYGLLTADPSYFPITRYAR